MDIFAVAFGPFSVQPISRSVRPSPNMAKPVAPLSPAKAQRLAKRLRTLRLTLGLDQGQFAKRVGVSQQVISTWEYGEHLRQIDTGMRLLRMLDKHGI